MDKVTSIWSILPSLKGKEASHQVASQAPSARSSERAKCSFRLRVVRLWTYGPTPIATLCLHTSDNAEDTLLFLCCTQIKKGKWLRQVAMPIYKVRRASSSNTWSIKHFCKTKTKIWINKLIGSASWMLSVRKCPKTSHNWRKNVDKVTLI